MSGIHSNARSEWAGFPFQKNLFLPVSPKIHESVSAFLAKQRDYVLAVRRHALHPRFNLKRANYKEGVEGSQITIAGAVVNLLLSIFKAIAGIYGNSAALVADAAEAS